MRKLTYVLAIGLSALLLTAGIVEATVPDPVPMPEPATGLLLLAGAAGGLLLKKMRG